jgi:hypothetical protein
MHVEILLGHILYKTTISDLHRTTPPRQMRYWPSLSGTLIVATPFDDCLKTYIIAGFPSTY